MLAISAGRPAAPKAVRAHQPTTKTQTNSKSQTQRAAPPQPPKLGSSHARRSPTGMLLAVSVIATLTGLLVVRPQLAAARAELAAHTDQLLIAAGFGIDEVSVSGHRFTADSDIFEGLDLASVKTSLAFDSRSAITRIERLPWVATASITRVYPGRLDVTVTERTPFAVWLIGAKAQLIDNTGRILQAVPKSQLPQLPQIAGEGAPEAARALFDVLAGIPAVQSRLKLATRITGRRWSLELDDGVRLELPPEGEAGALADLMADVQGQSLLAARDTIIDLRSRREIAVRPKGAT